MITTCVLCSTGDENTDPRATLGHLCANCANRILHDLRWIETLLPVLDPTKSSSPNERRAPGFASLSPARDEVLIHLDPRSKWDQTPGAVACLRSWAYLVAEERGIACTVDILHTQHGWICAQPWVDEYARELADVSRAVRAISPFPPDRPVGTCIKILVDGSTCAGPVFPAQDYDHVRCSRCSRTYTGLDLVRLRVMREAS